MSDEIKARRQQLSAELAGWIEARMPEFLAQLGGPVPTLPVVEDFRLIISIADGADPDCCDYYPVVDSGTSYHRQLGLVVQANDYLRVHESDDD